jgi:glycosyltransferase involved in cell wall biosynthesis
LSASSNCINAEGIKTAAGQVARPPRVSVILPTYNGSRTVVDAVRSILEQDWLDLELIVVDDASTQNIPMALAMFAGDARLRILRNTANSGLAASLNNAISAARGEFIARMDDDDFSLPTRISEQVAFLEACPEVDVVGAGVEFYDSDLNYLCDHLFPTEHEAMIRFLRRGNPLAHPSVMFRRSFIERAGGYDASLRRMEDLELWGRMAATSCYANIGKVLLRHRVRSAKTLSAVPSGIRIRLINGWRLGYLGTAILWTVVYVLIEVLRHWGYRQRIFRRPQVSINHPRFTE